MELVSADQFVDGLIAALVLEGKTQIDLDDPQVDEQFAAAYGEFLDRAEELALVPDFVMTADRNYGSSTCLRDAILSVRDSKIVSLNNPRFVTLQIVLKNRPAERLLDEARIPRAVLQHLAKSYLVSISN